MTKPIKFKVIVLEEGADQLCKKVTADLPEYFGIPEANVHYALGVTSRVNFAAIRNGELIALLSLDFPYPNNANVYWMGVMRKFHSQGIGKMLIARAAEFAEQQGAISVSVETLAPLECDEHYLKTYRFYEGCGFKPLFNLKPAGYDWNMVYMCKHIG